MVVNIKWNLCKEVIHYCGKGKISEYTYVNYLMLKYTPLLIS